MALRSISLALLILQCIICEGSISLSSSIENPTQDVANPVGKDVLSTAGADWGERMMALEEASRSLTDAAATVTKELADTRPGSGSATLSEVYRLPVRTMIEGAEIHVDVNLDVRSTDTVGSLMDKFQDFTGYVQGYARAVILLPGKTPMQTDKTLADYYGEPFNVDPGSPGSHFVFISLSGCKHPLWWEGDGAGYW
eukprot:CAMPEP_0181325504 /NCGR_PEP_ID=MMETSP1101-20121128/20968_1 /TAXON_ID=46948 /ORGANISM="Rhodomonas abbreviata, Strain Caron Lab Isolate" /LENGTH=196 /DNA_ID=CAMNT_0023433831 /DNA_START=175 /DNA_END=762 /DNA_ORIENTATION=+